MTTRIGAFIIGVVFFITLPAQTASVNRADVRIQTLQRSAVVVKLLTAGSTIKIEPNGNVITEKGSDGQFTLKIPVDLSTQRPTAVVFINQTKHSLLVQQQPPTAKRRTACIDKLNVAALMELCKAGTRS